VKRETGLVALVCLVCLVYLLETDYPDKPEKPQIKRTIFLNILWGVLAPGVVLYHCVYSGVQEDFHGLLERRSSDRDLPEEQSLQCTGRSEHLILLLNGINRDLSAVAKMTGNQRHRSGN
jgi:hypothetical protein